MQTIALYPVNILHIIYVSVAILGILMVWGKPQYRGLMMLLALHTLAETLNIFEELNITRDFLLITPALQIALGPLYYLFAKNLINKNFNIKAHLFHFIPTCLALAFTTWWHWILVGAFISLVFYLFLTFRLLFGYRQLVQETTADVDNYGLSWLYKTLILITVIEVIDFIRLNLQWVLNIETLTNWYFISTFIGLGLTTYLLINALRQPKLYTRFENIEELNEKRTALNNEPDQLANAKSLFDEIEKHLNNSKAFLTSKYSLRTLSESLGLSEQMVSWAINTGGNITFSDLINQKRIDEVKLGLANKNNTKNILNIAFDAGFNSKSSFNGVFKRLVGKTPTQYIKSL